MSNDTVTHHGIHLLICHEMNSTHKLNQNPQQMAQQQEEGWPLGLQQLYVGVGGMARSRDLSVSLSSNTLLTASPLSSHHSSDLDSQSTGSFCHEKSITLGRLIGISSILELSPRSTGGRMCETARRGKKKKKKKTKAWFLSLCARANTDALSMNSAPSLGQFLEAERNRNNASPSFYGVDDFSHVWDSNSLFVGGGVAKDLLHQDDDGAPLLLSCLCGNLAH